MKGSVRFGAVLVAALSVAGWLSIQVGAGGAYAGPPLPPPAIGVPVGTVVTNADAIPIEGTGEPGDRVVVLLGGSVELCDTLVGLDGSWSCTADLSGLDDFADVPLTAVQSDPLDPGTWSRPSPAVPVTRDTVPPVVPVLDEPLGDSSASPAVVQFSGVVADPADAVRVLQDGDLVCAPDVIAPDGFWSCNATIDGDGEHAFVVRVTDPAGNSSLSAPRLLFLIGSGAAGPVGSPGGDPEAPPGETTSGSTGVGAIEPPLGSAGETPPVTAIIAESADAGTAEDGRSSLETRATPEAASSDRADVEPAASETPVGSEALPVPAQPTAQSPSSGAAASRGSEIAAPALQPVADWPEPPHAFGESLRTVQDLERADPAVLGTIAIAAVAFFLLLAVPTTLLESTLEENADRLPRWLHLWSRQVVASQGAGTESAGRTKRGEGRLSSPGFWLSGLGLIVAAALISGLVDDSFGIGPSGLRVVLALFLGLLILNGCALLAVWLGAGRSGRPALTITLRPATLAILAVTVLCSRLLDLQPGVLFGLLVGVGVGAELAQARQARISLAAAGVTLGLGGAAWIAYTILAGAPDSFATGLGRELSTALVVEALSALVVSLLPLSFLDGKAIWEWSRWAWFAAYVLAATAFAVLLLPIPDSWVSVPSLAAPWVLASAGYALLSAGVWAYFRYRPTPSQRRMRAISKAIDSRTR